MQCHDYDLCAQCVENKCFNSTQHHSLHAMFIMSPTDEVPSLAVAVAQPCVPVAGTAATSDEDVIPVLQDEDDEGDGDDESDDNELSINASELSIEGLMLAPVSTFGIPPGQAWSLAEADILLDQFDLVRDKLLALICPLDGKRLAVDEIRHRINEGTRGNSLLKAFLSLHLSTVIAEHAWKSALHKAEIVHKSMPPQKRFLSDQIKTFEQVVAFMQSAGDVEKAVMACGIEQQQPRPRGIFDMVRDSRARNEQYLSRIEEQQMAASCCVINLARELHADSDDSDDNVLEKHAVSALALLGYAKERGVQIAAAICELDSTGLAMLRRTAHSKVVASIGYHFIIQAKKVDEFIAGVDPACLTRTMRDRLTFLQTNALLNRTWRGSGYEAKRSTKTLLDIYEVFRQRVERMERRQRDAATATGVPCVSNSYKCHAISVCILFPFV
jgi:hypothetical protein